MNIPASIHAIYIEDITQNVKQLFLECFKYLAIDYIQTDLSDITFGWKYLPSISDIFYQPKSVFCNFQVNDLSSSSAQCICHYNWFSKFIDPFTIAILDNELSTSKGHVRTTNLDLIHDKSFRQALACGLNHILEQPTKFAEVIQEILLAWDQLTSIFEISTDLSAKGVD